MADHITLLRDALTIVGAGPDDIPQRLDIPPARRAAILAGKAPLDDHLLDWMTGSIAVYRRGDVLVPVGFPRPERRRIVVHHQVKLLMDTTGLEPWITKVRSNIAAAHHNVTGLHLASLDRWEALIDAGDLDAIRRTLISPDPDSAQLRDTTPFQGILHDAVRRRALAVESELLAPTRRAFVEHCDTITAVLIDAGVTAAWWAPSHQAIDLLIEFPSTLTAAEQADRSRAIRTSIIERTRVLVEVQIAMPGQSDRVHAGWQPIFDQRP